MSPGVVVLVFLVGVLVGVAVMGAVALHTVKTSLRGR